MIIVWHYNSQALSTILRRYIRFEAIILLDRHVEFVFCMYTSVVHLFYAVSFLYNIDFI